jgi:ABC-type lipoprotein release transport system permease subunit
MVAGDATDRLSRRRVGTLLVLLLVAALAGLLAAQMPARRAARIDLLGALASE